MYCDMNVINNGIKYFINFGKYCLFSVKDTDEASVSVPLTPESINDVVDKESNVDKLMAFDSLINKKYTNSTNGTMSIMYNVVFGVMPMSVMAA